MLKDNWIPLSECIDKGFYKVGARNFSYGIFNSEKQGFIGIRHKFHYTFLDIEDHWDTGYPYGTVKPEKFIKMCELDLDDKNLMNWIKENENI